jgi:hypothetical protein
MTTERTSGARRPRRAPHWRWILAATAGAALLAGCNDSDETPIAELRAIHASADAPAVDVAIDGTTQFRNLSFTTASPFFPFTAKTTSIAVSPTGTSTAVLNAAVPLTANRRYSAIVVGRVSPNAPSGQQLSAVVVEDPNNAPAAGKLKIRVVHGAPGVPAVDVYVTAPGAALPTTPTVPNLAYTSVAPASGSNALEVDGGTYQIRITATGDTTRAVVFDSGSIPLAAGADLLVTAVPATGLAPVQLLVAPSTGTSSVIADSRAAIRVGHLSPNVPAVNVSLNRAGTTTNLLSLPNVSFPTVSGYARVPSGAVDASVALASNPATPVLTLNGANLAANTSTSVFAIGLLGGTGTQAVRLAAYADDRAPVADRAKIRVIHLSPDAPAVDVVALAANGSIATRLVTNLAFPNATPTPLLVTAGTYTLAVVPTGASTPVLPTAAGATVTVTAGQVLTIAAVGCLNTATGACAGGSAFGFQVLNDL